MSTTKIIGYGWKAYEVINGSPCNPTPLLLLKSAEPIIHRRQTIRQVLELIAEDERRWEQDPKNYINHAFDVFIFFTKDGGASTFPILTYQYERLMYGLLIEAQIYEELSSKDPIPKKPLLELLGNDTHAIATYTEVTKGYPGCPEALEDDHEITIGGMQDRLASLKKRLSL
jgi:hypothetical protein